MSAQDFNAVPPLRVERLPLPRSLAASSGAHAPLSALAYGSGDPQDWMTTVNACVLSESGAMADVWRTGARIESGTTGAVRWRCDGHWMMGAVDLDEAREGAGLAELGYRAYRDLFQSLAHTGCVHVLRFWNYLPHINADGGGLERYRQFNLGRHRAFVEAGRAVFEGAPAACALGLHQGALCVRFLAGRTAPLPVENPRQVSAYHYPSAYGPRSPTFSRAALAEIGGGSVALFISGTASVVGHETMHLGDVRAQTEETLRNLEAVIVAANERGSARFALDSIDAVVYVRHRADTPIVREVLERRLGARSHLLRHAVFLEADVCRHDLLVEIEAHAVAAGSLDARRS